MFDNSIHNLLQSNLNNLTIRFAFSQFHLKLNSLTYCNQHKFSSFNFLCHQIKFLNIQDNVQSTL